MIQERRLHFEGVWLCRLEIREEGTLEVMKYELRLPSLLTTSPAMARSFCAFLRDLLDYRSERSQMIEQSGRATQKVNKHRHGAD
jgi:hypothetical protein